MQLANKLVLDWYLERLGSGVRVPLYNDENPALAGLSQCGREESNLHGLIKPTRPSTLRVYQFRHGRGRAILAPPPRTLTSSDGPPSITNMCSRIFTSPAGASGAGSVDVWAASSPGPFGPARAALALKQWEDRSWST